MAGYLYIIKNKFTPEHVELIDSAVKGMMRANAMEEHSDQRGCYGGFSDALTRLLKEVYGEEIGAEIYNRYNFDHYSGEEFIDWLNAIITTDQHSLNSIVEDCNAVHIQGVG